MTYQKYRLIFLQFIYCLSFIPLAFSVDENAKLERLLSLSSIERMRTFIRSYYPQEIEKIEQVIIAAKQVNIPDSQIISPMTFCCYKKLIKNGWIDHLADCIVKKLSPENSEKFLIEFLRTNYGSMTPAHNLLYINDLALRYYAIKEVPLYKIYSTAGHKELRNPLVALSIAQVIEEKFLNEILKREGIDFNNLELESKIKIIKEKSSSSKWDIVQIFKNILKTQFIQSKPMEINVLTYWQKDPLNSEVLLLEMVDGNHRLAGIVLALGAINYIFKQNSYFINPTVELIPQEILKIKVNGYNEKGHDGPRWIPRYLINPKLEKVVPHMVLVEYKKEFGQDWNDDIAISLVDEVMTKLKRQGFNCFNGHRYEKEGGEPPQNAIPVYASMDARDGIKDNGESYYTAVVDGNISGQDISFIKQNQQGRPILDVISHSVERAKQKKIVDDNIKILNPMFFYIWNNDPRSIIDRFQNQTYYLSLQPIVVNSVYLCDNWSSQMISEVIKSDKMPYQIDDDLVIFLFDPKIHYTLKLNEEIGKVEICGPINGWCKRGPRMELSYNNQLKKYQLEFPLAELEKYVGNSGKFEFKFRLNGYKWQVPPDFFPIGIKFSDAHGNFNFSLVKGSIEALEVCHKNGEIWENIKLNDGIDLTNILESLKNENSRKNLLRFANFRSAGIQKIAKEKLFRGGHPFHCVSNQEDEGRMRITRALLEENKIENLINLSEEYSYNNYHILSRDVAPDEVYYQITSEKVSEIIKEIFYFFLEKSPPFYFHCHQGKDRTGIVIAIFQALLGEKWEDIATDYLLSNKSGQNSRVDLQLLKNVMNQIAEALHQELNTEKLQQLMALYFEQKLKIPATAIRKLDQKMVQ